MKTLLLLVFLPAAALTRDQVAPSATAPQFTAPLLSACAPAAEKAPAPTPARPDTKRNTRERASRPAHLFM
jgi:hypothetical protein